MAKMNTSKNTVRFTFFHTSSDQNEMCKKMKRGRWKSEESLKSLEKRVDTLDLPPRRPSRDQDLLDICNDLFISDLSENDEEDRPPVRPLTRSKKMPRSILKTSSKYSSPCAPPSGLTTKKYKRSPTRFDASIYRSSSESSNSESSNSDSSLEKPTRLSYKHKDSILNLPQLAIRHKPKLKSNGLMSPLSLPSLVADEDEYGLSQNTCDDDEAIGLEF